MIPQLTVQLSILASDGRELVVEAVVRAVTGETMGSSVYRDISVNDDYTNDKTDPFADLYVTMVNDIVHSVSSAPIRRHIYARCHHYGMPASWFLRRFLIIWVRGGSLQRSTRAESRGSHAHSTESVARL